MFAARSVSYAPRTVRESRKTINFSVQVVFWRHRRTLMSEIRVERFFWGLRGAASSFWWDDVNLLDRQAVCSPIVNGWNDIWKLAEWEITQQQQQNTTRETFWHEDGLKAFSHPSLSRQRRARASLLCAKLEQSLKNWFISKNVYYTRSRASESVRERKSLRKSKKTNDF